MVLKKIGLTGSTGMLGRHLQAALEKEGAMVVPVSRTATINQDNTCWDLTEWIAPGDLDGMFAGVQAVIHAGAIVQPSGDVDVARMYDANVRACLNLGEWAKNRNIPVIYISGAIVYADTLATEQKEEALLGWKGLGGFYGFSKLLAEDVLFRLHQQNLKLAVVRPTSIYGFGITADKMVRRFLAIAETGGVIELTQPVHDRVDLVHAADISRAVMEILKKDCWDIFNISSGNPISIKELAEECVKCTGLGSVSISGEIKVGYKPAIRYSLNSERAQSFLDWLPEIDIQMGLDMVLQERVLAPSSNSQQE
jgi:UDP-glucose 4-epimerase